MTCKFFYATLVCALLTACGGGSGGSPAPEPTPPAPPPSQSNTAPSLQDDVAVTQNGAEVRISVLANDTDDQNDPLTITSVTQPDSGNVSVDGDVLVFTPPDNTWAGAVTFSYEVSDSELTSTATVSVNVSQVFTFSGIALVGDTPNAKVQLDINGETLETNIEADNSFEIAYSTQNIDDKAIRFRVTEDNIDRIVGTSKSLVEVARERGNGITYSVLDHPDMLLSPISTALSAIAMRYSATNDDALEQLIDGDVLLELAAINLLINQGELTVNTDILSVLTDDELLNSLSLGLLASGENVELSLSENGSIDGLLIESEALDRAKEDVKKLVAPFTRILTAHPTSSSQFVQSKQSLQPAQSASNTYLDYYQLRPGYQGRVANYAFGGAQLRLLNDGTGTYWAAKGSSSVNWQEQDNGELLVTVNDAIVEEQNSDLATLNINDVVSDEIYALAPQNLRFADDYSTYLTSFSLLRVLQGDQVDIIATSLNYDVVLDSDSPFRSEADALNIAEFPVTLVRNLEYHDVTSKTVLPFSNDEIVGVWGLAVAGGATFQTREADAERIDGLLADLVTFTEQGRFSSLYQEKSGSWTLNESGQILLTQDDGWELLLTRIVQEQEAQGVLVRASNSNGLVLTEYRLMAKQTTTAIDLTAVRDQNSLWNASWVMNNPNHYNFDGSVKDWAYFGFQFGDTAEDLSYRLSYVFKISDIIEREVRNSARYVNQREDQRITIERRFDGTSTAAECQPSEGQCYTFWKRVWIPLAQTEDRIYVLEHLYMNVDILSRFYSGVPIDTTLYFWPSGKVNYYEKTPYPNVTPIE